MKKRIKAKSGKDFRDAVNDLSDELKTLSDDELDQISGGTIAVMCSGHSGCRYNFLKNRCDCNN